MLRCLPYFPLLRFLRRLSSSHMARNLHIHCGAPELPPPVASVRSTRTVKVASRDAELLWRTPDQVALARKVYVPAVTESAMKTVVPLILKPAGGLTKA